MTDIISALHAADRAMDSYDSNIEHDALCVLITAVHENLSVEKARERANGYAAGREDASGIKTVPAPDSPRGDGFGWMDFADAFAQAQADFSAGRVGMGTNCKAAYERWTETGGRTVHDAGTRIRA